MGYRHISLSCKCGLAPSRIDEVGLTDEHELIIHWWCEACNRVVYASKSLSDCWQECPRPATGREIPEDMLADAFDAQFMQRIGVRLD
jgi:hypothetical protein